MKINSCRALMGIQSGEAMTTYQQAELPIGEFLGDYQILELLGRGTIGTTYHVVQNALQKEFVIKVIPVTPGISFEWYSRLELQCTLLRKIHSPFIDEILSTGRLDKFLFLLKDFVSGWRWTVMQSKAIHTPSWRKTSSFSDFPIVSKFAGWLIIS